MYVCNEKKALNQKKPIIHRAIDVAASPTEYKVSR